MKARLLPLCQRIMTTIAVPRHSQLHPGTPVKVVLKADQPSGKLTTGSIADILTRHDHPRGVKVRLVSGQIGRVQSISSTITTLQEVDLIAPTPMSRGERHVGGFVQEDYRNDPTPAEERSLEDYIKKPAQKKKNKNKNRNGRTQTGNEAGAETNSSIDLSSEDRNHASGNQDIGGTQQDLEIEFPTIDSALVAAILADHPDDLNIARETLKGLSAG